MPSSLLVLLKGLPGGGDIVVEVERAGVVGACARATPDVAMMQIMASAEGPSHVLSFGFDKADDPGLPR